MTDDADWHPTACILGECNCGIEIQLDGRRFDRIRGDMRHPSQSHSFPRARPTLEEIAKDPARTMIEHSVGEVYP